MNVKVLLLPFAAMGMLAVSCTPTQKGAAMGAAGGAALGAIIADDDDHKKGAAIGAVVGGIGGAALGKNREKQTGNPNDFYY